MRIYLCILGVEILDISINEPLYAPPTGLEWADQYEETEP